MLLYLVAYLGIGVLVALINATIEVIVIFKKGYDLEIFNRLIYRSISEQSGFKVNFIVGLFIWPIRLIQNRNYINDLIELYEKEESK